MDYISIKQASKKWGITPRRIQILCVEGRVAGAIRVGTYWAIPSNAEKPIDKRLKNK